MAALKLDDVAELVTPIPDAAPPVLTQWKGNTPSHSWTYTDETGRALFHVCRFDRADGGKDVLPQTLWRTPAGARRWYWKGCPTPRPLYRLHDLARRPDAPVVIVEGEKTAEAAARYFAEYVITTSHGGCKAASAADWSRLKDRSVTIWPDNDDAGRGYASDVAGRARVAGASNIRIVSVPIEWPKAWDLADDLPSGVTPEVLIEMLTVALPSVTDDDPDPEDETHAGLSTDNDDAELEQLAALSPIEYDRRRKTVADKLSIRPATLDGEMKRRRPALNAGQGAEIVLAEPRPWHEAVDGADWLSTAEAVFTRHAALPEHAAAALALWCLHSWVFDASFATPRLAITSPQPRCGKSTVLRLAGGLVPRPLLTANATVSVLFRVVEMHRPSLMIDEADAFLSDNNEMRGLLNSGFERDGGFLRNVGDGHEPRRFSTNCPVAIALIGKLPATLEDRSIKVPMRRAVRGEVKERFRPDRPAQEAETLRAQAARWREDNIEALQSSDPGLPESLHDRARDCWRPLVAIADLAGGAWPSKARTAALALSGDGDAESLGVELLKDIRAAFDALAIARMGSAELVAKLIEDAERPWATADRGRPLTQNTLARRLRPFDVTPKNVRLPDGSTPKGYALRDFGDAFSRYLGG